MDEEQLECLKDKIKSEVRAEVKFEVKEELEKELMEKIEKKLRVEIQNQIGCMWADHFERFNSEESERQNARSLQQGFLEQNHGCEMGMRAPRGFERFKQHRDKLMCVKCRRWDHQKENSGYAAYCSYCGIEGHSDKNHRNGVKSKKYPIAGPKTGVDNVSSF